MRSEGPLPQSAPPVRSHHTVVHILGELRRSGAEVMLANSIATFQGEGVSTRVIATGRLEGEFGATLRKLGASVTHIPFVASPSFLKRLMSECQQGDAVHIHTERASFWIAALLRLRGMRTIRTIHSSFLFQGRLRYVRAVQRRLLTRLGVTFVAIGDQVAENEESRFGIHARVIRNWADEQYYTTTWHTHSSEGLKILSVGNCGEPKNHDVLLKAIALVCEAIAATYIHLGDESGAVIDERRLAQDLGIAERVRFAGSREPLTELQNADLFIMPSTREGFGLAALEAMAMGVPTLLADSPGLREFSSVPGVWWADPTPESLADVIAEIARTALADRVHRGRRAAAHVRSNFGPEAGRNQYLELYRIHAPAASSDSDA